MCCGSLGVLLEARHMCLSCAMVEAIDPICRSPLLSFPICFTILDLA